MPIKGAENLRYSPGLQDEINRAQRAFDRRQAAEAQRAALARDSRRRYIPPDTPPLLRKLYRNMLPSPDDPRPEDFTPDDATPDDETPDDAPDRSGPTALGGLRSRYPRLFRSPQPPAPSTGDDPPQAAPSQDAATSSDGSDANPSPPLQTSAPMADTTSKAAADDDGVALLASIDPLSHVTPASTHGLVQYASNDRVQFDAVSTGEQTKALPAMPKQVASQTTADPDTHTREESEAFDNVVVDQTISELPSLSEDQVDLPHFMLYLADPNREGYHIDVYSDSEGNLTTGIGHKILPADHLTADDLISDNEVKAFFQKDAKAHSMPPASRWQKPGLPITTSYFH